MAVALTGLPFPGPPDHRIVGIALAVAAFSAVRDLRVDVRALTPEPAQVWGVQSFSGQDDQGRRLELAVYGRMPPTPNG